MNNENNSGGLVLGLIIGAIITYFLCKYQGKTAKDWFNLYTDTDLGLTASINDFNGLKNCLRGIYGTYTLDYAGEIVKRSDVESCILRYQ